MPDYFYTFGDGQAQGAASMKELLGGKGANLAEMNLIGVPVPPGFTITTEACTLYMNNGASIVTNALKEELIKSVAHIEKLTGTKFGDKQNPCLVSVRSGARVSMPGMMDTILNLGLCDEAVKGLAEKTNNPRFAWDSYRRFIQMYGSVVMGMKPESKEDIDPFEAIIEHLKEERNITEDTDFTTEDLQILVAKFKKAVLKSTKKEFPDNPWDQLWGAVLAVFDSWMNDRAILYRKLHNIPAEWGTAVNVQAMVFGNMGENSATGVAFTRDAGTGENLFNGEYLINAQGEDVVAGTRTPQQISIKGSKRWAELQHISEEERATKYPSLEETMPSLFAQLNEIQKKLELHYHDMQDIEFTIQEGKLWLLQTRNGKRTGAAMVKIALDLMHDGLISEETFLMRMEPNKIDELLHPIFDTEAEKDATVIAKGLPASPGAATGRIVFFADEADHYQNSILVRIETSPEDLEGMHIAKGILTARGGMTSHAAVVARGMGKCCVSGAGEIVIDYKQRTLTCDGKEYHEGDWISLNGTTGKVYDGSIKTINPSMEGFLGELMEISDKYTRMKVRTNADTPHDAKVAREFGAEGIGLCRTEHMFFDGDRIKAIREMILAKNEKGRRHALDKLLPYQRTDFEGIFRAMEGFGVTIRLLDPPLHEFVPHQPVTQRELANDLDLTFEEVKAQVDALDEVNPMLGHRGCRLGNTYPEITEMQTRAIIEAACNLAMQGITSQPEIMIPLVGSVKEFELQASVVKKTASKVCEEKNIQIEYKLGTMIEVPRATLVADKIAETAEFFSFGTNDLTQMTFGFSRDDVGKFLPIYIDKGLLEHDPFEVLDQEGVGQLVQLATQRGRATNPELKIGICGEHGGEPESVKFCDRIGLNYVSCSPFRVPIARLSAAQSVIEKKLKEGVELPA